MPDDLLAKGSEWLEEQRTRFMSRTVSYHAVRVGTVDLQATIGKTIFRLDTGYGATERTEARDYLFLASDLVVGGVAVLPKPGDQIYEVVGGKQFIYEVMAPGGEPAWRYSDPYRQTLRVHTKLVSQTDL